MESKLYVGNLPYSTTEDDLRALFSQAGSVVAVDVIKDRDTGRSKGFAFVQMSSQAEIEQAIKLFNAYELEGRALKVNQARPKEERNPGGYGGGRNRGGGGGFGRSQDRSGNRRSGSRN